MCVCVCVCACVCVRLSDLDVLALRLVVEHVRHVAVEDLLSSGSSVNADHGHSDGPRSVPYGHL